MARNLNITNSGDNDPTDETTPSTETKTQDTPVVPDGPKVHESRRLGGTYVHLGGGERVLLTDDTQIDAGVHKDDAEV